MNQLSCLRCGLQLYADKSTIITTMGIPSLFMTTAQVNHWASQLFPSSM